DHAGCGARGGGARRARDGGPPLTGIHVLRRPGGAATRQRSSRQRSNPAAQQPAAQQPGSAAAAEAPPRNPPTRSHATYGIRWVSRNPIGELSSSEGRRGRRRPRREQEQERGRPFGTDRRHSLLSQDN